MRPEPGRIRVHELQILLQLCLLQAFRAQVRLVLDALALHDFNPLPAHPLLQPEWWGVDVVYLASAASAGHPLRAAAVNTQPGL